MIVVGIFWITYKYTVEGINIVLGHGFYKISHILFIFTQCFYENKPFKAQLDTIHQKTSWSHVTSPEKGNMKVIEVNIRYIIIT